MNKYPTHNGIAVPVWDIVLPPSRTREHNNHHNEWSARAFGRSAVLQSLRDLERHQYVMPLDQHNWLHKTYAPPELPSEAQAAREVIDAYEEGERFKRYDRYTHTYRYEAIPPELIDRLMAQHAIRATFALPVDWRQPLMYSPPDALVN